MLVVSPHIANTLDADAVTYINAVEQADGQPLEATTRRAINRFVIGLKANSIWGSLDVFRILCGARTLAGALIPLKDSVVTNVNFTESDYNRKTGLKGDPDNSTRLPISYSSTFDVSGAHFSVYRTEEETNGVKAAIANSAATILLRRASSDGVYSFRVLTAAPGAISRTVPSIPQLIGVSRPNSTTLVTRCGQVSNSNGSNSTDTLISSLSVFSRTAVADLTDARLSWFSVGKHIDLAVLETLVAQLMTDINNAF
jgi:hypothetical protein